MRASAAPPAPHSPAGVAEGPATKLPAPTPTAPATQFGARAGGGGVVAAAGIPGKTPRMRKPAAASTYPEAAVRSTGSPGTWCRRAAGPRPPENPGLPLGLAKGAQHAAIPGRLRCSGRPKFSSIQGERKLPGPSAATAAGDSAPGGRLARGREAVPLLGVQVRPNLEGRARFQTRAESAGASPAPLPSPAPALGDFLAPG